MLINILYYEGSIVEKSDDSLFENLKTIFGSSSLLVLLINYATLNAGLEGLIFSRLKVKVELDV